MQLKRVHHLQNIFRLAKLDNELAVAASRLRLSIIADGERFAINRGQAQRRCGRANPQKIHARGQIGVVSILSRNLVSPPFRSWKPEPLLIFSQSDHLLGCTGKRERQAPFAIPRSH